MFTAASLTSYGGGEQSLIFSANYLVERGVMVTVFDYGYSRSNRMSRKSIRRLVRFPIVEYHGIRLFGAEQAPFTRSYISALVSCRHFDVAYSANSALTHTIPLKILTRLFNKRAVFEVSDPSFDPIALSNASFRERAIKTVRKMLITTFPAIRVLNRADQQRYKNKHNSVCVIPPPSREFRPSVVTGVDFSVLFAARLDLVQKGIDMLPEIVGRVLARSPDVRFVVVGSGGAGEAIIRNMETQYAENVKWLGFVPDEELELLYRNSQLFMLTSRYETFGISVVDALKNGLPVVAFNIPGPSEIIRSEVQGTLVPQFDIDALASCISEYYEKWKADVNAYVSLKQRIIRETGLAFDNGRLLDRFHNFLMG